MGGVVHAGCLTLEWADRVLPSTTYSFFSGKDREEASPSILVLHGIGKHSCIRRTPKSCFKPLRARVRECDDASLDVKVHVRVLHVCLRCSITSYIPSNASVLRAEFDFDFDLT